MGNSESRVNIFYMNNKIIKETVTPSNQLITEELPVTDLDKLNYTENDWKRLEEEGGRSLDFCMVDGLNGIPECIGLFTKQSNQYVPQLDQYRVRKSNISCNTLVFRPGTVIANEHVEKAKEMFPVDTIQVGNKCYIEFQDYNYDNKDLIRCCLTDDKSKCNKNLTNDFSSTHCNVAMNTHCPSNPNSNECIRWLEQTHVRADTDALNIYSKLCSENHNMKYCDYMCKVSRQKNNHLSQFCDHSLNTYCQSHLIDTNCHCVITPSVLIPEVEEYLGPRECWLPSCTTQPNNKWLLTEQITTRGNCQLTSCIISIDSLTLNKNSTIQLINDCVSGTKVSSSHVESKPNKQEFLTKSPGLMFCPEIGFLCLAMIVLILIK